MLSLTIGGKAYRVDPANPLGQGGEACVYDLKDGRVVKVYREPSDPTFAMDVAAQAVAKSRITGHQTKLREFPKGLPARVVAPLDLAHDRSGRVVGYTMPFVKGGEVLLRFTQPAFRKTVPQAVVLPVLLDLGTTLPQVHRAGVVVGDFNDQNVMVVGSEAYLIDADSMQFGRWACQTYTTRFVDPILCTESSTGDPVLTRPHSTFSDWYAFSAMVFQVFCWTDVYGGTYVAPAGKPKLRHGARPMHRIPVWHPDVRYPRPAMPFGRLPDDLMQHMHRTFEKDARDVFPLALLQHMRWTTCATCGTEHARSQCPQLGCAALAPAVRPVVQTTQIRGTVTATTVYPAGGLVLRAETHGGKVLWIAHDGSRYVREDGTSPMGGALDRTLRFRLLPTSTFVALGPSVVQLPKGEILPGAKRVHGTGARLQVQLTEGAPVFGVTPAHTYWCEDGALVRDADEVSGLSLGTTRIGNVLAEQTRFWVGDKFGFGFYRASALTVAFVFDAEQIGINDTVPIQVRGKLLDATCTIAGSRAWFFTATQEGARTVHRCYAVRRDGTLEGVAESDAGDGSWLGSVRGGAAVGNGQLRMPTDDGVVRVEVVPGASGQLGSLQATRTFPDTEPWVDAGSRLLIGSDGLYVVGSSARTITRLVIK